MINTAVTAHNATIDMTHHPIPRRRPRIAVLLLIAGFAGSAGAQRAGEQRLWLQFGAFYPNVDSSAQISDPASGISGTPFDFESELGLAERKTLGQLLIGARLSERWRSEFEYFSLRRSASRALATSIVVDDTTFPVAAVIDSEFDSKVYRLGFGYSFLKTPAFEGGLAFGAHVTDFRIALGGQGSAGGGAVTVRREQRDATVPLPTIGVYGSVAFSPSWQLAARADLFSLESGGYDGRLLNLQANLIVRFSPTLGIGLGYRLNDYRVTATRGDFNGRFEYEFRGPQAFVEVGF